MVVLLQKFLFTVLLIDTGVNTAFIPAFAPFVVQSQDVADHGTQMASLILYGDNSDSTDPLPIKIYPCTVYRKSLFWQTLSFDEQLFLKCLSQGFKHDYILLAMNGTTKIINETVLLRQLDYERKKIIISAGNDKADLDETCHFYPICYIKELKLQNAVGVGAINGKNGEPCNFTNTGSWLQWENGCFVSVYNAKGNRVLGKGTSHAAALYLHKELKKQITLQRRLENLLLRDFDR